MKIVYFSFPYTSNPKKNTEKVKSLARAFYSKHEDVILLIPHLVFDAVYNFPCGYALSPTILIKEIILIEKSDVFMYCKSALSCGVLWELAIAKRLGKEIWIYEEMMK